MIANVGQQPARTPASMGSVNVVANHHVRVTVKGACFVMEATAWNQVYITDNATFTYEFKPLILYVFFVHLIECSNDDTCTRIYGGAADKCVEVFGSTGFCKCGNRPPCWGGKMCKEGNCIGVERT